MSERNGEAVGILEQFAEQHPDFSFDGAKGTISLTGFECVFGYVTERDQADDRAKNYSEFGLGDFSISDAEIVDNKENALSVIDKLRSNGWTFASSTYGNISVGEISYDDLVRDTGKWMEQVGDLVGDCKVLLFPNGSVVSSKDPRGQFLIEQGFQIHCGIGPAAYFNQGEKHLFMDRIALNGIALRNVDLSRFFDVKKVYDPARSKK